MAEDSNTNKKNNEENIRKLQRTGRAGMSYMVTLPKDMIDELGWRERQKVTVKKDGNKLIIEDWEEES
jgi:antitoxin component of MazEF toxin-antitoxin module